MKRLCLALALLLLCGCSPDAREPENLALARVLGVDGVSPVTLTAVCARGKEDCLRNICVGETFGLARDGLPWAGERELALTGVSWIVLGRDTDAAAVLYGILEDRELGAAATVWLAETGAAQLLEDCEDPVAVLELLKSQGIRGPTAARALGTLVTEGSVLLPVLGLEDGNLRVVGEERRYGTN